MEAFGESDLVEQAHGVIAARLDVDPETAAQILHRVAVREKITKKDLAADVVSSCTSDGIRLPRDLYTNGRGYESVA
jgi:ANTAR domain